jgi:hypothetical protein
VQAVQSAVGEAPAMALFPYNETMTKNTTPLEHDEQVGFVGWIDTQNEIARLKKTKKLRPILFSAIVNGHYQQSKKQLRKLIDEGMRKGILDMVLIIPPERAKGGRRLMIWIEMKRQQGGAVSADQEQWIEAINDIEGGNVGAFVCYGEKEAVDLMKDLVIKL